MDAPSPRPKFRRARALLYARVVHLTEEEARRLRERLLATPGVVYADVDPTSGFTELEYERPCSSRAALALLRSTGKPVILDFACC